jgi:hypothetical protein
MKLFALMAAASLSLAAAGLPDCTLAPGWEQHGEARTYEGDTLYEYMNGNSEGYFIYGFVKMNGVTCKKGPNTVHIDVSEMANAESAYGMFTANRDASKPAEKIGMGGQVAPRKAIAAKDKYFLEIAAEPDKDHSAALRELISALEARVQGSTSTPAALEWFVKDGLEAGFPRLVPQSVLGIGALKRGYVAHYQNKAKAFVVTEASPDAAKAVLAKLQTRFGETAPATVAGADEAFTGADKYLGRLVVLRKGNRVAGIAGVPDGGDPAALGGALAAKLP